MVTEVQKQPRTEPGHPVSPWSEFLSQSQVQWGEAGVDSPAKRVVFVFGNAYGLMPYQQPLASSLAEAGFRSVWTSAPGQGGARGRFGMRQGVEFLRGLVAASQGWDVALLCHCASTLGVLQLLAEDAPPHVRCLVSYGPLLNLSRLRERALPRLRAAGVEFDLPQQTWELSVAEMFTRVSVPTMIAHSTDTTNRRRASLEQIRELANLPTVRRLFVTEQGYDEDLAQLPAFSCEYATFFRENMRPTTTSTSGQ